LLSAQCAAHSASAQQQPPLHTAASTVHSRTHPRLITCCARTSLLMSSLLQVPLEDSSARIAAMPPIAAAAAGQAPLAMPLERALPMVAEATHAVSSAPVDSAVDAISSGVTAVVTSPAVAELDPSLAAPSAAASSANSAKSQSNALARDLALQPQAERQGSSGSRDKREKLISSPSRGLLASEQGALLLAQQPLGDCAQSQGCISSPSAAGGAAVSAPGVGAGAAAAPSASAVTMTPAQAALAASARAFRHTHSSASSAAAQHDGMDVDDESRSASSVMDLTSWAAKAAVTHCLIVDHARVLDRHELGVCLNDALSSIQRKKAVLEWLSSLKPDGLAVVFVESSRLHLHFEEHCHLAQALKDVPCLMRCGGNSSSVWSKNCYGDGRHKLPEALLFSVKQPVASKVPPPASHLKAMTELVAAMGIEAQSVWQTGQSAGHADSRFKFWVLPRETDPEALVALIERVHRKHELFGALVDVAGPNLPQLVRCSECHVLGHSSSSCPRFGGVAVRLVFNKPVSPVNFSVLIKLVPGVRSAMLGNTFVNADAAGVTSYKATLFFNADESTPDKKQQFEELLTELGRQIKDRLLHPPARVTMREAERRQECVTCGAREKEHVCPFHSGPRMHQQAAQPPQQRQQQQQQQQQQPVAQGNGPAASSPSNAATEAGASAQSQQKPAGMCGAWRNNKLCTRTTCKQRHPEDWFPVPVDREQQVCRDFYTSDNCKRQQCKYEHWSLAQEQAKQATQRASAAPDQCQ
jgi:hypothetical protein